MNITKAHAIATILQKQECYAGDGGYTYDGINDILTVEKRDVSAPTTEEISAEMVMLQRESDTHNDNIAKMQEYPPFDEQNKMLYQELKSLYSALDELGLKFEKPWTGMIDEVKSRREY